MLRLDKHCFPSPARSKTIAVNPTALNNLLPTCTTSATYVTPTSPTTQSSNQVPLPTSMPIQPLLFQTDPLISGCSHAGIASACATGRVSAQIFGPFPPDGPTSFAHFVNQPTHGCLHSLQQASHSDYVAEYPKQQACWTQLRYNTQNHKKACNITFIPAQLQHLHQVIPPHGLCSKNAGCLVFIHQLSELITVLSLPAPQLLLNASTPRHSSTTSFPLTSIRYHCRKSQHSTSTSRNLNPQSNLLQPLLLLFFLLQISDVFLPPQTHHSVTNAFSHPTQRAAVLQALYFLRKTPIPLTAVGPLGCTHHKSCVAKSQLAARTPGKPPIGPVCPIERTAHRPPADPAPFSTGW